MVCGRCEFQGVSFDGEPCNNCKHCYTCWFEPLKGKKDGFERCNHD